LSFTDTAKRLRLFPNQRKLMKLVQYRIARNVVPLSAASKNAKSKGRKVLANSFPKAGTNLLKSIFNCHPLFVRDWSYHLDDSYKYFDAQLRSQKPGQLITLHSYWSEWFSRYLEESDQKMVFILRDLRDMAVSNFFYITYKDPSHRLHSYFQSLKDDKERLKAAILGVESTELGGMEASRSLADHAEQFKGWMTEPNCLVVRFENLIGSFGGGSEAVQIEEIRKMFDFVRIKADEAEMASIIRSAITPHSRTFRKGRIGDWRNHFDEEIIDLFKKECGSTLIEYGYEETNDWR